VTDASGDVTKTVYLRHDQSITIKGLAEGAKYSVTETPEDYKSDATNNVIAETSGMEADATAAFTNTRAGNIPTGVLMTLAPFVGLTGAAAGGIAVLATKKSKKSE
jgi:hypothetical protein